MQPCAASKNSRAARSVNRSACSGSRTFRSWTPSPSRNLRAASSRSIGTIRAYQHRLGPCQRQEGTGHLSYPIFLDARAEIGNDAWLSGLCKKHGATHLSPHGVSGPHGCSRLEYASCPNPIALTKEIERSCVGYDRTAEHFDGMLQLVTDRSHQVPVDGVRPPSLLNNEQTDAT